MSQGDDTLEKKIFRCEEHEEIILNTLMRMEMENSKRESYIHQTKIRYLRKKLTIAFEMKQNDLFLELYDELKRLKQPRLKEYIYKAVLRYSFLSTLFNKVFPILRLIFKVKAIEKIFVKKIMAAK